ncbi:M23 family metallopeptidase [Desulfopila inferna]|uniref:M23 family metallopeptidase n=1 Tax=Desulfopila inferna TaxID=468528 RepID=UPI001964E4B0|nr:M23 family metallopeptidase [Desulfopila inferna]MBM9603440.1 M23 family metallopeptidase [Desulfopila inferna]
MNEQFHFIIAGDQRSPFSFQISKKKLIISAIVTFCTACALLFTGFFTTGVFAYNKILVKRMALFKEKIHNTKGANSRLENKLAEVIAQNKVMIEDLKTKNNLLISKLELENNRKIAELERKNLQQAMSFKEEKDRLLSTAVTELNNRSEFIETIISDIGIKVTPKDQEKQDNSGGPFIAAENAVYDELIYRTDHYLKTIQALPLGTPVIGSVSSWFGKRKDPLNSKNAFHEGIDFRGKTGDPVIATADGKVVYAGVNGGYGKYVRIDHGNGYTTCFGHLDNYHVKKGDYVTRGQTIGLVGNSGRSTGSHLHYEINLKGRPVNPAKFMKVADLKCKFNSPMEK